jgi:hypothetical protein
VQLCHPELRNEFPPLRVSKAAVAPDLPAQLTNFVGREAQITEVGQLLAANRLVTVHARSVEAKAKRHTGHPVGVTAKKVDRRVGRCGRPISAPLRDVFLHSLYMGFSLIPRPKEGCATHFVALD